MAVADQQIDHQIQIGPRVRALREAMDFSLRDLAVRSGVSAPMLSQVERGETSPTLAVAGRIAAGLDLRLSQLLRLGEEGAGPARRSPPPGASPPAWTCASANCCGWTRRARCRSCAAGSAAVAAAR